MIDLNDISTADFGKRREHYLERLAGKKATSIGRLMALPQAEKAATEEMLSEIHTMLRAVLELLLDEEEKIIVEKKEKLVMPITRFEFKKLLPKFLHWLEENGSKMHHVTNQYEIARFSTPEGIGIVYVDKNDVITSWNNGAFEAVKAFVTESAWSLKKGEENE